MLQDRLNTTSPILLYGAENEELERAAKEMAFKLVPLNRDAANHPDVHIYQPENKADLYSIEAIRTFIQEMPLPPYESPYKVYIFGKADRMLPVHANALLKTLEEKPAFAVIFLLATNLRALLPTIISRCQKLYLPSHIAPTADPKFQEALSLFQAHRLSDLFALFESLDKEEHALEPFLNTFLAHFRTQKAAHLTQQALLAKDRHIKTKHILEYLFLKNQ